MNELGWPAALHFPSRFGNLLALKFLHDSQEKTELKENEEWRKLFEAVANEPDPQRLSELIDQLIKNLDSRRARAFAAATGENQSEGNSGC